MAFENVKDTLEGASASSDLSAAQFLFVKIDGESTVGLAGAGESIIGVLQNKPLSGNAASVATATSTSKIVAGAAVVAGADVTPNAAGKAVTAISGDYIAGQCITGAANADEFISVKLTQPGRAA